MLLKLFTEAWEPMLIESPKPSRDTGSAFPGIDFPSFIIARRTNSGSSLIPACDSLIVARISSCRVCRLDIREMRDAKESNREKRGSTSKDTPRPWLKTPPVRGFAELGGTRTTLTDGIASRGTPEAMVPRDCRPRLPRLFLDRIASGLCKAFIVFI